MTGHLQQRWAELRDGILRSHPDVAQGQMMSADALTHGGKVFVFFSTKGGRVGLGCRVGRNTDIAGSNLQDWQHLAPFKSKPPMKDWIVLGEGDLSKWEEVSNLCLSLARTKGR